MLVLLALTVWAGIQLWTVQREATAAAADLGTAQRALTDADVADARTAAQRAADHAERADTAAGSPVLALASALPGIGDDVRAVRAVATAGSAATRGVVLPLVDVAEIVTGPGLSAERGRIDLSVLEAARAPAAAAAEAGERADAGVRDLDTGRLVGPLRAPVEQAATAIADLAGQAALADRALQVLPEALGAQGPRDYLLGFQNLAEARPTGGIVGAWALVRLDDGALSLEDVGANDDLERLSGPVRDLPADVEALYGQDLARSQNVNLSPHFPQAGALLSDLWQAQGRPAPAGVVSVDPVALSRVLSATGPIQGPDGEQISGDTVVQLVQARVYRMFEGDNRGRNVFLSQVTAAVFQELTTTDLSAPDLRRAMGSAVADGHVQLWLADPPAQALVEDVGWAGALPEAAEVADAPQVRLHVTNVDASKLDHYLRVATSVDCADAGPVVALDLTSQAPDDLPAYATNRRGETATTHRVVVSAYLPPRYGLDGLTVDGTTAEVGTGTEQGWKVVRSSVDVPAGATTSLQWLLTGDRDVPRVLTQPFTRPAEHEAPQVARCSDR